MDSSIFVCTSHTYFDGEKNGKMFHHYTYGWWIWDTWTGMIDQMHATHIHTYFASLSYLSPTQCLSNTRIPVFVCFFIYGYKKGGGYIYSSLFLFSGFISGDDQIGTQMFTSNLVEPNDSHCYSMMLSVLEMYFRSSRFPPNITLIIYTRRKWRSISRNRRQVR